MFKAILHTPVSFFDANPIGRVDFLLFSITFFYHNSNDFTFYFLGRILNRFTKDIGQMDSMLPMTFVDFYQVSLRLLSAFSH